jgi:hypothetical protein
LTNSAGFRASDRSRHSASRSTSSKRNRSIRRDWRNYFEPCAQASSFVSRAETCLKTMSARFAVTRAAGGTRFVLSKKRKTSLPSSAPANSQVCITCWAGQSAHRWNWSRSIAHRTVAGKTSRHIDHRNHPRHRPERRRRSDGDLSLATHRSAGHDCVSARERIARRRRPRIRR